jgi:hypothetical protein
LACVGAPARRKVERRVTIANVDDLPDLFDLRTREGYEFGGGAAS